MIEKLCKIGLGLTLLLIVGKLVATILVFLTGLLIVLFT